MAPYRLTGIQLYEIPLLWKSIAVEYSGRFRIISATSPSMIASAFNESTRFELEIPIDNVKSIFITAGEQHHLKATYSFGKDLNFLLQIFPEDIFEKINKLFGTKDLKTGHEVFDKSYLIKSNNSIIANQILHRQTIEALLDLDTQNFQIITEDGESRLFFMPFFREEDEIKMKKFIRTTKVIISKFERY